MAIDDTTAAADLATITRALADLQNVEDATEPQFFGGDDYMSGYTWILPGLAGAEYTVNHGAWLSDVKPHLDHDMAALRHAFDQTSALTGDAQRQARHKLALGAIGMVNAAHDIAHAPPRPAWVDADWSRFRTSPNQGASPQAAPSGIGGELVDETNRDLHAIERGARDLYHGIVDPLADEAKKAKDAALLVGAFLVAAAGVGIAIRVGGGGRGRHAEGF